MDTQPEWPHQGATTAIERFHRALMIFTLAGNTLGGEFARQGKKGANSPPIQDTNAPSGAPLDQSRNNSLIAVFDRVRASTRLTMTAQYKFTPFFDGNDPATTTE